MEDYIVYKNAAFAIIDHLKWMWESLEQKIEYLRGESQTFDYDNINKNSFSKKVISSIEKIINLEIIENNLYIYILTICLQIILKNILNCFLIM